MFERYNEKARRTIFFARYEASTFGSPYIESEHMLLGLLREDRALSMRFITPRTSAEALREEIERHHSPRESIPTSVDLPLSNECKHILAYATEESERLAHQVIGTEHLLLGILREQNSFASELLQQHGLKIDEVRQEIAEREPPGPGSHALRLTTSTLGFFQLALRVANLEASIDFYSQLGFTSVGERGSRSAVLTNGSCNLRLDENLTAADHLLSFLSPDITPTVSRLESAGVKFEQSLHTAADGRTTALLRDPDGNIISLVNPRYTPPPAPPR
jgi:catechol 2,3-dioxygenase-like lactoylglutathione lyase family enzyme